MTKTFTTLFSGAGGVDLGLIAAGFEPCESVEHDPQLAELHKANIGGKMHVMNILDCDPFNFNKIDILHASTVCKSYSSANTNKGEQQLDIDCAMKTAEFIQVLQPPIFTLENVQAYLTAKDNKAFKIILEKLYRLGYWINYQVLNAADFSVPQSRRRLILVALKRNLISDSDIIQSGDIRLVKNSLEKGNLINVNQLALFDTLKSLVFEFDRIPDVNDKDLKYLFKQGFYAAIVNNKFVMINGENVPSLPAKEKYIGWYEAIKDKVHDLPDSDLAPWQWKKLKNFDWQKYFVVRSTDSWYSPRIELANFNEQNKETIAAKVLQELWERNDQEALREWSVRVLEGFQPSSVLRYDMSCCLSNAEGTQCRKEQVKLLLLFKKIGRRWGLRDLWEPECNRCPSQGWGLDEQFFGEFAAYLSQLSCKGAQAEASLLNRWVRFDNELQGVLQQTLSSFQKIWRSTFYENHSNGRQEIFHQNGKTLERGQGKNSLGRFKQPTFQESEGKTSRANGYKAILLENTGARSDRELQTRAADEPCWTLRAMGHDGHYHRANALLIHSTEQRSDKPFKYPEEPCHTILANHGGENIKALLENAKIKALDIACLARLQSFPDDYNWSGKKSLDGKGIGNSVPPLMMEKIARSVLL